ncbi:glycoside hydrolase family 2 protein [Halobacteria archaeon AArc-m2/3/4]|uniref:Beta-mannosidase n=1 Tax=Natronoglomus mannanivorans TaxID=2979990 RepID=A0ABT2QKR1_9EURY|nr:glycoside hydrolase family 2 protein [Halobacteria archaeon AArc-m2/3/4]
MDTHSLNGTWQFRPTADGEWRPGTVPGDVYSDLLATDTIDDPYDEDNELDVQWVGETDWTYRREFEVDDDFLAHDALVLECLGVDTVSEISVNGTSVGETTNMHRAYTFDLGDALEAGENRISVRFRSPVEYGKERMEAYPYEVPLIRYPVDQPGRNFIRKAQCHYGWDWGPCLPGVGLWRDIRVLGYSGPRITHTTTEQTHHEDGVTLSVRVGADVPAGSEGTYDLTATVADTTAHREISLEAGEAEAEIDLTVSDPELWWPNGYGDQPLYDLDVTLSNGDGEAIHTESDRIGFRDLNVVREPDGDGEGGESFAFEVNGEPIYAKGANWIPIDAMRGNVTDERVEELLTSATAANMNTIRVWGGGYYELDTFYELCDELGLLVWQDFMFSCALYPATDEFLETVEAEVRYQVRRLANHPSIALWCGNNENEMSLVNWFDDSEHIDEFYADYERLNDETIAPAVEAEDPSRTFWPGSPSSGGLFTDDGELNPHDQSRGDLHYWRVWHDGEPFEDYLSVEPRFVSEFGYQSFASVDLLSEVVPDDQLNPTAPIMEHHQRHPDGNKNILQRMADHFRIPFSFDDLVYLSQIQQGLAMEVAIEHWRRLKPYCMGTLYWQLNDLWPCASWSSIEYGDDWKALQYMARRFYAPVLVSTVVDDEGEGDGEISVWLTSDRREPTSGTLSIEFYSLEGERLAVHVESVAVESHGSRSVATLSVADELGLGLEGEDVSTESLLVRSSFEADGDGEGEDTVETYPSFAFFEPYKHLELPEPELSVEVDGTDVVVETTDVALFVALETPVAGHFSDNYFHMVPGERRRLSFEATDAVTADDLRGAVTVRNLRETY